MCFDLLKVSRITYDLFIVSKMTILIMTCSKLEKMTYDLFKVNRMTTVLFDLFKVSQMITLILNCSKLTFLFKGRKMTTMFF